MKRVRSIQHSLLSYSVVLMIVVFGALLFWYAPQPYADAATTATDNAGILSGFAWSDNIGWIDFNPVSGSGVYVDSVDGVTLGGYAWSDNIGWISFKSTDSAACGATKATLSGTKPSLKLVGWARALSDGGGWDGCINLGQASTPVTYSGSATTIGGYGWGSEVIGWIAYNAGTANVMLTLPECNDGLDNDSDGDIDLADSDCINRSDPSETGVIVPPGGTFRAEPATVTKGADTTLKWEDIENVDDCQITADATVGNMPYPAGGPAPFATVGNTPATNIQQNTTFTLHCTPSTVGAPDLNLTAQVRLRSPIFKEI